jgi:uncharacterized protein with NAD-binding domain and iron-sulfur cluster
MSKKVAILGGGVAGMSAAHELIRRGFQVEVYECLDIPGGKARSVPVPNSGLDGRLPLPGEHGFRFFPRFYKHITATMNEIPVGNARTAFDNLVDTTRIEMARFDRDPIVVLAGFPRNLTDVTVILKDLLGTDTGVGDDDLEFFAERVWQIMTSCGKRRMNEYEKVGWWEFIDAARRSIAYQKLLGLGLTRSLVAAQATLASSRTVGHIFVLLLFNMLEPGASSDRVLNGPTNEAWIEPWKVDLERHGVRYHLDAEVTGIQCENAAIKSITVSRNGAPEEVCADYFLMALPAERLAGLLTKEMLDADPTLADVKRLGWDPDLAGTAGGRAPGPDAPLEYLAWMNGAQFYLYEDLPVTHGHVIYVDSPWALTSISQKQFWTGVDLARFGDGRVKGILSVDISSWDTAGILYNKTAKECTREEIRNEVWAQLKRSLNVDGKEILKDDNLHSWFLDPDIEFVPADDPDARKKHNTQPLLVNLVNSWHLRPNAYTRIANLFLASDFVQTNTDLATMEGANEAARRAVNAIIDASGVRAPYCRIWKLNEPGIFKIWRFADALRFARGLPWKKEMPWWASALQTLALFLFRSRQWLAAIYHALISGTRTRGTSAAKPR